MYYSLRQIQHTTMGSFCCICSDLYYEVSYDTLSKWSVVLNNYNYLLNNMLTITASNIKLVQHCIIKNMNY